MSARKTRKPLTTRSPEPPEAALVRIHLDDEAADTAGYFIVRATHAPGLVADATADGHTAEILEPGALPLTEANAPAALAAASLRAVLAVGTAEGSEWATWHPPYPPEPVPGSPAWRASQDQAGAARADALSLAGKLVDGGGRMREAAPGDGPPAIEQMFARFEAGIQAGNTCPHKASGSAQLTHIFGAHPDVRLCDRCAKAPMAALSAVRRCDLCGQATADPTVLRAVKEWLVFHMVLCDGCYPEGADAPRRRAS
jgi:hypothetical protein